VQRRQYRHCSLARAALVLTALIGTLSSNAAHAQESYALRRVYRSGESDRYQTVLELSGQGSGSALHAAVTLVTTEVTKDVKADGTVTLVRTIESATLKINDSPPRTRPGGQAVTETYDATGRLLRREVSGTGQLGGLLELTGATALPNRTLRVGEEWRFEHTVPDSDQKVTGSIKLLAVERKGELVPTDSLKLKSVLEATLPSTGGGKSHVDAILYVEPETGKVLRAEGVITGALGAGPSSRATFKRIRIQPGVS
jgi:hypothetical protein